jgi:transposase
VIRVEDWAEIRRLRMSEEVPIRVIARMLGVSRNAVRRALASERPPKYERPPRGSAVDDFEPAIRQLLLATPTMPATVIAERIGWTRSSSILRARVAQLRPLFVPLDPASRTSYDAGELMQCDLWFPAVDIALGHGQLGRPPVLVMVTGYSRMISAVMIPTRQAADLIAGHWRILQNLGVVPRALVWDNEGAVGSWRRGKPKLAEDFEAFRGVLGVKVIQCRPRDPEAKGIVERANGFLETSFLPGRSFSSPADFNTQLSAWLPLANQRKHRALGCQPAQRWEADKAAMLALPPVAPVMGWRTEVRLPRDHYVRLDGNDYSVHPSAIGRRVQVSAGLEQVRVRLDGRLVGEHARCWANHQTITDPAHRAAAEAMRKTPKPALTPEPEVEQRDLGAYDVAFGLSGQEVA